MVIIARWRPIDGGQYSILGNRLDYARHPVLAWDQLTVLVASMWSGLLAIHGMEITAPPYCLWQEAILSTGCCRTGNLTLGAKRHIVC